jgi:hypothetical protein
MTTRVVVILLALSIFTPNTATAISCAEWTMQESGNCTCSYKELDDKVFAYPSGFPIRVKLNSNQSNGASVTDSDSAVVNLTNILEQNMSINSVNVTVTAQSCRNITYGIKLPMNGTYSTRHFQNKILPAGEQLAVQIAVEEACIKGQRSCNENMCEPWNWIVLQMDADITEDCDPFQGFNAVIVDSLKRQWLFLLMDDKPLGLNNSSECTSKENYTIHRNASETTDTIHLIESCRVKLAVVATLVCVTAVLALALITGLVVKRVHTQLHVKEKSTELTQEASDRLKQDEENGEEKVERVYARLMSTESVFTSRSNPQQITQTPQYQVPSNNEYDIPVHAQYWQPSLIDSEIYSYMERNQFNIFHHSDVQILNAIGEGEFGLVCKGECKLRGQVVHVAVKRAKEDNIDTSTTKLLQEAAILGQFHHKNVIKLIGIAKLDETENVMILTEYLCNGDLKNHLIGIKERIQDNGLATDRMPSKLIEFCRQIASGMEYLSGKGFVHRDLAARNILLDGVYTCRVRGV